MTTPRRTSRGPVIIDATARYRAVVRQLRNTGVDTAKQPSKLRVGELVGDRTLVSV